MEATEIKNILIIRPDAIGDCVLITPAIKALKNCFPNATISVLAQELTRDIFATNPDVTEVLTDIKQIKTGKYDLSIHYYNELPYALAAKRAKIKYRLGDPSKFPVGLLYNLKYRQNWRDITKHDVEQNMLLLKPLGIGPLTQNWNSILIRKPCKKSNFYWNKSAFIPKTRLLDSNLAPVKGINRGCRKILPSLPSIWLKKGLKSWRPDANRTTCLFMKHKRVPLAPLST
jgi:ADP-heptose:LPS heptosyltransferase